MIIRGTVTDAATGETLPGANIFISDAAGSITAARIGTASDAQGSFALNFTRTPGQVEYLTASFVGYDPQTWIIGSGEIRNFRLQANSTSLAGVTITGQPVKKPCCKKLILAGALAGMILLIWLYAKRRP